MTSLHIVSRRDRVAVICGVLWLAFATVSVASAQEQTATDANDSSPAATRRFAELRTVADPGGRFEISVFGDMTIDTLPGSVLAVTHSIPFSHRDPCDFSDSVATLDNLTDFSISIQIASGTFAEAFARWRATSDTSAALGDSLAGVNALTDTVQVGSYGGYRMTSGAEGCGEYWYYFPLAMNRVLVVRRDFITELNPIIATSKMNQKLPGVIPPSEEDSLFQAMISSIVLTK